MVWTLHPLNARGALDPVLPALQDAIGDVRDRLPPALVPPVLDIVIQPIPGGGIPETGVSGHSARPGVILLTVDPGNPSLTASLGQPLARQFAHELHHALRWDTVGYGRTLGEALVSEGLAGLFVHELFANPPEPWEAAVPMAALPALAEAALDGWGDPYDHGRWFFGTGRLPRWAGYTLGYCAALHWSRRTPGTGAAEAAAFPADRFLATFGAIAAGQYRILPRPVHEAGTQPL